MCLPVFIPLGMAMGASAATAATAGTMMAMSIAGTAMSAYGSLKQGQYQSKMAKRNAQTQEVMAKDAVERGNIAENAFRMKVAGIKGEQRANLAASNVNLQAGSPLTILEDTAQMGELDALSIRANAEREAYGHRVGASNALARGELASSGAAYNAMSSVLSGAGSVSRDWYLMNSGADPWESNPGQRQPDMPRQPAGSLA